MWCQSIIDIDINDQVAYISYLKLQAARPGLGTLFGHLSALATVAMVSQNVAATESYNLLSLKARSYEANQAHSQAYDASLLRILKAC